MKILYGTVLLLTLLHCACPAELGDFVDRLIKRYRSSNCEYSCRSGGRCLLVQEMCNGWPECPDGSDEDIQTCVDNNLCLFTCPTFRNPSKTSCVKEVHLCDDVPVCDDKADEANDVCEHHGECALKCIDRKTGKLDCLDDSKICNRQVDCRDKSDESHELCVKTGKTDRECPFMCPGENEFQCVLAYRICDHYIDCPDTHADELKKNCHLKKPRRDLDVLEELLQMVEEE